MSSKRLIAFTRSFLRNLISTAPAGSRIPPLWKREKRKDFSKGNVGHNLGQGEGRDKAKDLFLVKWAVGEGITINLCG